MKATFWQRGEALDYVNETDDVIEANTVIIMGTRIGVIGTEIAPKQLGTLHVTGVFEMEKEEGAVLTMGSLVYFDGEKITTTEGSNTLAGYAAQNSSAADKTVYVKLLG